MVGVRGSVGVGNRVIKFKGAPVDPKDDGDDVGDVEEDNKDHNGTPRVRGRQLLAQAFEVSEAELAILPNHIDKEKYPPYLSFFVAVIHVNNPEQPKYSEASN